MKKLLVVLFYLCYISININATLYEHAEGAGAIGSFSTPVILGQTFTVGTVGTNESFVLDSIYFQLGMSAGVSVTINIYATSGGYPTGSSLGSGYFHSDYVAPYIMADISSIAIQPNTQYAIVLELTGGTYTIGIANAYSGGTSLYYNGAVWSINPNTADIEFATYGKHAPIITSQPTSITRCPGTSATFTVGVDSDAPAYQWRKGGSNISGATSASYTIASVTTGSAGNYDCVVTESLLGTTTTSSVATLTVPTTTSITGQPTSISRCVGASATFSVTASGSSLTYQWKKNGTNITGATSASYTISSVATGDAANYTVTVTGTCGTVTSSTAVLTVLVPPSISVHPVSQTKEIGESVTFSVTASGSSLTYQWRKDGSNISGATSSSYTIAIIVASDAASYDVYIDGTCGSTTSNSAILTISETPEDFQYLARKKILLEGKLRNVVLMGIERDFGGYYSVIRADNTFIKADNEIIKTDHEK